MPLIRIVRMEFFPDHVQDFLDIFEANQQKIKSSQGCIHLELCQDTKQKEVYFTYSLWETEAHLEAYRKSDLFSKVWPKTKELFSARPIAYSMYRVF